MLVNITDGVEICSLLVMEMLLIEVTNDVVFSLLVDVTLVDVTDDEDISSLLDNVLVGITDVVVVKVCSPVDITLVDTTDASSVLDIDLVNVTRTVEASALLDIRLAEKAEVCSLLDFTEEGMMDFIEVSILLDAALIDVIEDSPVLDISLVEACSLLDVTPVVKTDVVEVSPLLVATMVEVMDGTKVSVLLVVALALNVIDSGVGCSLLDVVVIEVRYNVVELLDSPLVVIIIGALVEISEVSFLCDIAVINAVLGEMTDDVTIGVSDDVKILLLIDIILVDNEDVTLLADVVFSKLFTPAVLNDVVELILMVATPVLPCIGINDV